LFLGGLFLGSSSFDGLGLFFSGALSKISSGSENSINSLSLSSLSSPELFSSF